MRQILRYTRVCIYSSLGKYKSARVVRNLLERG